MKLLAVYSDDNISVTSEGDFDQILSESVVHQTLWNYANNYPRLLLLWQTGIRGHDNISRIEEWILYKLIQNPFWIELCQIYAYEQYKQIKI